MKIPLKPVKLKPNMNSDQIFQKPFSKMFSTDAQLDSENAFVYQKEQVLQLKLKENENTKCVNSIVFYR